MEAVPVYNINPVGGCTYSNSNPWEAIALMNSGGGGGWGGMNSMWAFLPWLLLFGWGGFGGGFGGRGYGCGCEGGSYSNFAADLAVNNATATARNEAGLDFIAQNVNGIRNGLSDLNVNLCNQFAGVNTAINTVGYQTQLGQRDLMALIADCCCKTQSGLAAVTNTVNQNFCQLNYNTAMQTCELKQAIATEGAATRQLLQDQETDRLRAALAKAQQENFMLKNCGNYNDCGGSGC